GSIEIAADGSYTYTLDNADADTNALAAGVIANDVFTYTIQDSDGSTSNTTVTIAVTGASDGVPTVTIPDDNAGATGENTVAENASITGETFTITAPDGLASLSVGGTVIDAVDLANTGTTPVVINTTEGVITITGYNAGTVTYDYDPNGTSKDHDANDDGVQEEIVDSISIVVKDTAGTPSVTPQNLDILITDTGVTAVADTNAITEDAAPNTVGGNVIDNTTDNTQDDTIGADTTTVVGAAVGDTNADITDGTGVAATLTGT
ncbi:MAG: VCBS domain-containing protein, partial [Desulfotalea sp.]